ncbi:HET domain-containing [Pyrenophora seminiperda CCB06]|uniref:HET domain-containing n=1 Tax=Pyrenophora seminiperda CCB06 TaxID=1302712 RepID=A0A3M7M1H6_9PLEO|nr:HET domain-containing [Pyrenophora seminiperda CCB06]
MSPYNRSLTSREARLISEITYHPPTNHLSCNVLYYYPPLAVGLAASYYTALSYTWGAASPTHAISINGAAHAVPSNLHSFLQAYTQHDWGRQRGSRNQLEEVWIDQICIDQDNVVERSAQVGIMNKIYKNAARVLVWLGCEDGMVRAARVVKEHDGARCNGEEEVAALRSAVSTLLQHAYFSRVWVVQEIGLARRIQVACGPVCMEWQQLQTALVDAGFGNPRACRVLAGKMSRSALELVLHSQDNSHTLLDCIDRYSSNKCQDARDKVYGLLGLTPERWRVQIDYRKPVLQVYLDTLMALCEELFDVVDPGCCYGDGVVRDARVYARTLLGLSRSMGLTERQQRGLVPFIDSVQAVFLNTSRRNIEYMYTGTLFREVADGGEPLSDEDFEADDDKGLLSDYVQLRRRNPSLPTFGDMMPVTRRDVMVEKRAWGEPRPIQCSIKAVRLRPLVRDVIPRMGLQLAQGGGSRCTDGRERDRWWFEDEQGTHYFDCSSESEWLAIMSMDGDESRLA